MSKILESIQKEVRKQKPVYSDVAKKFDIPPQRVSEFMNAKDWRGLLRVEQFLKEFRPDIWKML